MDEQVWSWLEEAPEELLEEKDSGLEDLTSEFKRVKSLREEQETKLAEFLREDARKSHPPSPLPPSSLPPSPLPPSLRGSPCKQSGSVSPRKGKRIDKGWRRGAEWA